MNIDNYCRLCALPRFKLLQIFEEEGFKRNIVESINKCLKIEICEKDDLPRAVCSECTDKLVLTSKFIDATFEAQETLQRILNESRLLKKESGFVFENSLGDDTRHTADSMVSILDEENETPSKILVSMDDMDSSFFDEYVETLRDRNDQCLIEDHQFRLQMKKLGDSIIGKAYPRSISVLIDSDGVGNHSDEVSSESSKMYVAQNCSTSMQSNSDSLDVLSVNDNSIAKSDTSDGFIQISRDVFEEGKGKTLNISGKKGFGIPLEPIGGMEDELGMRLRIKAGTTLLKSPAGPGNEDSEKEEEVIVRNLGGFEVGEVGSDHCLLEGKDYSDEDSKGSSSNDILWPCAHCDQFSRSYEDLRYHHSNIHKVPMKYLCPLCSKKFVKLNNFLGHLKKHKLCIDSGSSKSSQSKLRCLECGREFSNSKLLDNHMMSHSDTHPFPCEVCGKSFRHQSALYLHARCHLPQDLKNKFQCDLCDKRFSTKPNLITHRRIHLGVRNFTCDQCGKSFIQKGNLDAHMLTHSSDKPFSCDVCEKSFKTVMQLRKHDSIHTGAKPHQCDVCGRMFRERGTLREHYRIHTGAMPFSCEFCGKSFRFKGILTTHRRQHTGERPYSCQECQHHFTNWPNYNKHMKRRHGINTSKTSRIKTDPSTICSDGPQSDITIKETESLDFQTSDITDPETYSQTLPSCIDNLTSDHDDVNDIILSSSNNFYNVTSSICANNFNASSYVHPFLNNPGPLINFYNLSHLTSSVAPLDSTSLGQNVIDLVHQQNR